MIVSLTQRSMALCLKTRQRQTGLQYRSYQLLTPEKRERESKEARRKRERARKREGREKEERERGEGERVRVFKMR